MNQPHVFSDEEKKVSLANPALFKALIPYVRPYAWMLALTTVLVFMVTGFELFQPWLIQQAIDRFILVSGTPGFHIMGLALGIHGCSASDDCFFRPGILPAAGFTLRAIRPVPGRRR